MEKLNLLEEFDFTYIGRDETIEIRSEEVLAEHAVWVRINGISAWNVTCIPEHLDLLILGRMLSEGIIESLQDVAELRFSDTAAQADVSLRACPDNLTARLSVTGSRGNGNNIFLSDLKPVIPIYWKPEWIFDLADHFAAGTPLHEKTWATHSCILACEGKILFTCEDISRHSALDKAIGFALKNSISPERCMIYSSGRIPTDMAAKAVRAGIPILISKASPTAAAVRLARECKLTLICAARKDRMKLFSGERMD